MDLLDPKSELFEPHPTLHRDICLLTAYENKHLLTGAKWSKNKQTNGLRTLRTDFLACPRFVVLTSRALCNAERVDTIHVQNNKHTIKDQWFENSIVPNGLRLRYVTLVRFLCSEMIDEGTTSMVCSYLRIWPDTHFGLTREATLYAALVETQHGQNILSDSNKD